MEYMRPGRKIILNAERVDRMCQMLEDGAYMDEVINAEGISRAGVYLWINRGEIARRKQDADEELNPEEWLYLDFAIRTGIARAKARIGAHQCIRKAIKAGTYQAAIEYLRFTDAARYGKISRSTLVTEGEMAETEASADLLYEAVVKALDSAGLTDDQIESVRENLAGGLREPVREVAIHGTS